MWSVVGRSRSLLTSSLQGRAAPVQVAALDTCVRSLSTGSGTDKHKRFSPRRRPSSNYRPTKSRGSPYFRPRRDRTDSFDDRHAIEVGGGKALPIQLGSEDEPATGSEDDRFDQDGLSRRFGPHMARMMRSIRREQEVRMGQRPTVEEQLRDMDYLTAPEGSLEELAYERRTLNMECDSEEEREQFMKDVEKMVAEQQLKDLDLDEFQDNSPIDPSEEGGDDFEIDINDPLNGINPNQKAFGEW